MNFTTKSLKVASKALLRLDLFGKDVHLTINKSQTQNTWLGTLVTLLIYLFLLFTIV